MAQCVVTKRMRTAANTFARGFAGPVKPLAMALRRLCEVMGGWKRCGEGGGTDEEQLPWRAKS